MKFTIGCHGDGNKSVLRGRHSGNNVRVSENNMSYFQGIETQERSVPEQ